MDTAELWSVLQQQVMAGHAGATSISHILMSKHDTDYGRITALQAMLDGDTDEWLYDILSAPEGLEVDDTFDLAYQVDWPEMNEAVPSVLGAVGAPAPRADQVRDTRCVPHRNSHNPRNSLSWRDPLGTNKFVFFKDLGAVRGP